MCSDGRSCGRCGALEMRVQALEREVAQWKSVAAHLAAILRRVKKYAQRTHLTACYTMKKGNIAPQHFHCMRGAEKVSGNVVSLTNG
jgi:arginyl-tRNA--protein-N-Asp/Glu arginylyltransferase